MKIINLNDFLEMQEGTLFCKYGRGDLDKLCIKGKSLYASRDFFYTELINTPTNDQLIWPDNIELEFFSGRDGEFDEDVYYLVFNECDVKNIVKYIENNVKF